MDVLRSIVLAFCTFSVIPMPKVNAGEKAGQLMLAMFPLVGLVIGTVCVGWWALCDAVGFGVTLKAAGLTLLPLGIAGGIHLDGFADVVDAVSSWAGPERRREILKDPHIGAFAAIGVAGYLLCFFAFASELVVTTSFVAAPLLAICFVLSRSLSGLTAMLLPKSTKTGMLASETSTHKPTASIAILAVFAVCCITAAFAMNVIAGVCLVVAALLAVFILYRIAMTKFGGMSGDLSGFFTQLAELLMLIALVIAAKVVGL